MIASVSVSRFVWMPLHWIFIVTVSMFIILIVCNIFDSRADNETAAGNDTEVQEEKETAEVNAFALSRYIEVWLSNRYKYVMLPLFLTAACLLILTAE